MVVYKEMKAREEAAERAKKPVKAEPK